MIFASALRRLTLVYTVIQLLLFAGLAIGVYLFVTGTFDFDAASQDGSGAIGAAEQGFTQLRIALIFGFAILCVVVPFTSYWMARAALAPLRQSYEQQQQFVDDASHELRSPLSVIRGELELALARPRSEEDYRRSISASLEATQTLVQLSEDLLLLARDSSVEFQAGFRPVAAGDIVRDAIAIVSHRHDLGRLTTHSDRMIPVRGLPSLLARAVANILENALKFTPATGTVVLTTALQSGSATISIADTGIGMTVDEVRHARERFWRSPDAPQTAGHGLGLALVDRIALAHHGRLAIDSSPGVGTTVTLTIPLAHEGGRPR